MARQGALWDAIAAADDAAARLLCLRRIAAWAGEPTDGWSDDAIRRAERRLEIEVPEAVREWSHHFATSAFIAGQDLPFAPADWHVDSGRLVVRRENQGVWTIQVALDDHDDPAAEVVPWGEPAGESLGRFSEYALHAALYDLLLGGASTWASAAFHGTGLEAWLEERLGPSPLPSWAPTLHRAQIFITDDGGAVLLDEGGDHGYAAFAARDEASLGAMLRGAPADHWYGWTPT